jgi:hypothetical protein
MIKSRERLMIKRRSMIKSRERPMSRGEIRDQEDRYIIRRRYP